jgi:hypothetical protein
MQHQAIRRTSKRVLTRRAPDCPDDDAWRAGLVEHHEPRLVALHQPRQRPQPRRRHVRVLQVLNPEQEQRAHRLDESIIHLIDHRPIPSRVSLSAQRRVDSSELTLRCW